MKAFNPVCVYGLVMQLHLTAFYHDSVTSILTVPTLQIALNVAGANV